MNGSNSVGLTTSSAWTFRSCELVREAGNADPWVSKQDFRPCSQTVQHLATSWVSPSNDALGEIQIRPMGWLQLYLYSLLGAAAL